MASEPIQIWEGTYRGKTTRVIYKPRFIGSDYTYEALTKDSLGTSQWQKYELTDAQEAKLLRSVIDSLRGVG